MSARDDATYHYGARITKRHYYHRMSGVKISRIKSPFWLVIWPKALGHDISGMDAAYATCRVCTLLNGGLAWQH